MSFGGVGDLSFDEEGFFGHTRAIERLALMFNDIGYHGGDGNQSGSVNNNYQISPGNGQGSPSFATENQVGGGDTVAYLGTLNLPIFGGSDTVAGNPAGTGAVDWQQRRNLATSVASGAYATIVGGFDNTASGDYSFAVGNASVASGLSSVAINGTASGGGSIAIFGTASNSSSVSIRGGTVSGSSSGSFLSSFATISGAYSVAIGCSSGSTLSGSGSVFINTASTINSTGDNSVIIGLANSNVTSSALIRNCFLVGPNSLTVSTYTFSGNYFYNSSASFSLGSGTISNTYCLSGGVTQSGSASTGSITGSLAVHSTLAITSSGSMTNTYSVGMNITNGTASSSINVFAACGGLTLNTAGFSSIVALGLGINYTATASSTVLIGFGAAPSYSPASSSTTIFGALGSTGGFGCNQAQPQTKFASGGAVTNTAGATYTVTEQVMLGQLKTLANNIRTALVNNGIMS